MKNLMKLVGESQRDLASLNIRTGNVRNWSVNTRAKARWGYCVKVSKGLFDIQIATALLQDDVDDQAVKDTIVHELLHTIPGCFKHTGKWKQYANTINRLLPQYKIKRGSSYEEKGLEDLRPKPQCRYILKCLRCGSEIGRQRMSAAVEHPEHYRCKCGGRLTRIK
ncbi:MAG: sprT domain-containing protein [Oscillospiraceae bacterium]|nr:sprT domain-containing protein [Oscillospiraceae bacterium]MBQ8804894.1 hypothetical protein [Bacteroidaceae bacterium]